MLLAGCNAAEQQSTSEPTTDTRPNILLIIGDDMGFSDVGAFGSEVATPNIDALASEGLSFTNFHVGATCSPTRSLLLTGVDNHRSGLGNMHEFLTDEQRGKPGYEGYLNRDVVTIIQLICDAGYSTYMTGKWHLGADEGYRPHDRGFDKTYSLLQGAGSNYWPVNMKQVALVSVSLTWDMGRVYVAPPERRELERRLRSRSGRIEDARRARVILLLAAGHSYREICTELRCSHEYIARWKTRFQEDRLGGLDSRHVGRQAWVVTPKLEARVLNRTRQPPSDGSTHWSSRKLAKEFRISHVTVTQIWKRAGLKPHRIKRYMASNDPDFETKAADIIGLYLKPPKHAAIFSLDEKTAIQALDRLDPVLPLSPGRLERHGFEYYRHGNSFSLRRTRYVEWRGLRQDGDTSHQRGVREVHGGAGRPSAPTSRNPRHPGQPFGPQDGEGAGLLGSSSESTSPFSRRPTPRG